VLGTWLGKDRVAIDALLAKFRATAVEAKREIDIASRAGDFAKLAAAAHKLKGAAQLEQAGKAGDPADALNCLVRWQRICVLQYLRSSSTRGVRRVTEFSILIRLHHWLNSEFLTGI
jgi:hypothetical protein